MKLKSITTTRFTSLKSFLSILLVMLSIGYSISQCNTIYVTTTGTGNGLTMNDPSSIEDAFINAVSGTNIRIATGVYQLNSPLIINVDGLIVEGGFEEAFNWRKSSLAGATTLNRKEINWEGNQYFKRLTCMLIWQQTGFELHDLTLTTDDADDPASSGVTTYGLYIWDCSNYKIVRCQLLPGNGRDGKDGEVPTSALPVGDAGGNGGQGTCTGDYNGGGGSAGAGNTNGGSGGKGGHAGFGLINGLPGDSNPGSDCGGTGGARGLAGANGTNGKDGTNGCAGATGSTGAAGSLPSFNAYFVHGGFGAQGGLGDGGTGGGGGGGGGGYAGVPAAKGGSGGGGGEGGQGGLGAYGTGGGGGSFGAYIYENGTGGEFIDCFIEAGLPGLKGAQVAGQAGSAGGAGGIGPETNQCALHNETNGGQGGIGGQGGRGGTSGPSWDGVAINIVLAGTGTSLVTSDSTFDLAGQPLLTVVGSHCLNQVMEMESTALGTWDYDLGAEPSNSGNSLMGSTYYLAEGFRDLTRTSPNDLYSDFVNPTCSAEYNSETDNGVCNSYVWATDGNTYYDSGIYTYETVTNEGCLRVDTLHLTINDVPGLPVPDIAILDTIFGGCSIPMPTPPTAVGVCSGEILNGTTTTSFPITTGNTHTVTWTYFDGFNTITQDQVFVRDQLAPRIPLITYINGNSAAENGTTVDLLNYNVPAGTDRLLVVSVGQLDDVLAPTVTFDGTPMNLANSATHLTMLNNIYYLPLGTSGVATTGNIVATTTNGQHIHLHAARFENVDQVNTIGNTASAFGNDPSTTIVGSSGNKFVDFHVHPDNTSLSYSNGQTTISNRQRNGGGNQSETKSGFYSCYGGVNIMGLNAGGSDIGLYNVVEINFGGLPDITGLCDVSLSTPFDGYEDCGPNVTPTTPTSFPVVNDSTITWTYSDDGGNSVDFTQNIIISDVTGPTPDLLSLPDVTDPCEVTTLTPPTATDDCAFTVSHDATLPINTQGTTIVTWTYEDVHGWVTTQSQNVIIDDVTSPSVGLVSYNNNGASTADFSNVRTLTNFTVPAGEDRVLVVFATRLSETTHPNVTWGATPLILEDTVIGASVTGVYYLPLGSGPDITETITATSSSSGPFHLHAGSFSNVDQTNTIGGKDEAKGATVSLDVTASGGSKIVDYFIHNSGLEPAELSNQTVMIHEFAGYDSQSSFIDAVEGSNQLNYTGAGNSQYYIGMELNFVGFPELTDQCSVTPTPPLDGVDNCSGVIVPVASEVFPITTQGETTVTWTYDDTHGNPVTIDQIVTIDDTQPPIITSNLDDINDVCMRTYLAPPVVYDNCDDVLVSHNATLPITAPGLTVVTWTVDDQHGNVITQDQNVYIENYAPTPIEANLPAIFIECWELTSLVEPVALTFCSNNVIGGTHNLSLPISAPGSSGLTVTWTYEDEFGLQSQQTQDIFFVDNTAPTPDVISLLDITAECEVTSLVAPTATDNCASSTVVVSHNATLPINTQGINVVTWSYDDGHGNVSTQTQNVIIDDVTVPVADETSLADITSECEVTSLTTPSATDNCLTSIVSVSNDAIFPINTQGTTVVTWTYDDGHGNTSTQLQNVIINDVTAPIPDAVSLSDETAVCEITSLTVPTASDNCLTSVIVVTNDAIFPITDQGTTVVTWSFDDGHGNISTQEQNVIINDDTDPVADLVNLPDVIADCEVTMLTPPTGTDNCTNVLIVTHNASLPITNQGTTLITWTLDDGNGNTVTQSQNIIIDDVTAPVPDEALLADVISECEVISLIPPTATDECSSTVTVTHDANLPITSSSVVNWTYDDGNGNTVMQTQNVSITSIDVTTTLTGNGVVITANNSNANAYQWIDCKDNVEIIGATNVDYTATEIGEYAVIITVGNCSDTSECVLIDNVGIDDIDAVTFSLYPNPTSTGEFSIKYAGKINRIELIDVIGKVIPVKADQNFKTVYGSELAKGKYLVRLFTENDGILQTQVIVMK